VARGKNKTGRTGKNKPLRGVLRSNYLREGREKPCFLLRERTQGWRGKEQKNRDSSRRKKKSWHSNTTKKNHEREASKTRKRQVRGEKPGKNKKRPSPQTADFTL